MAIKKPEPKVSAVKKAVTPTPKEPVVIRIYGKIVSGGKSKNGTEYKPFVAFKTKVNTKLCDFRFPKERSDSDNDIINDIVNAVADGSKVFDITVTDFWDFDINKFPCYFAKGIKDVLDYTEHEEDLPF